MEEIPSALGGKLGRLLVQFELKKQNARENERSFLRVTNYSNMGKHSTNLIIEVEIDNVIEQVELPPSFIDFYKKETSKSRVTKTGLAKFITYLIERFDLTRNHD